MTMHELQISVAANRSKAKNDQTMLAWAVCHLVNVHLKKGKGITVSDLMEPKPRPKPFGSVAEMRRHQAKRAALKAQES